MCGIWMSLGPEPPPSEPPRTPNFPMSRLGLTAAANRLLDAFEGNGVLAKVTGCHGHFCDTDDNWEHEGQQLKQSKPIAHEIAPCRLITHETLETQMVKDRAEQAARMAGIRAAAAA